MYVVYLSGDDRSSESDGKRVVRRISMVCVCMYTTNVASSDNVQHGRHNLWKWSWCHVLGLLGDCVSNGAKMSTQGREVVKDLLDRQSRGCICHNQWTCTGRDRIYNHVHVTHHKCAESG